MSDLPSTPTYADDRAGLSVVYLLTNPAMPGLVKIGRTSQDDAQARLDQLYTTGVPVPFELAFAARVPNHVDVERALHTAFGPQRVNPKREFFRIDPEQARAILQLLHVEDATDAIEAQPSTITSQEKEATRALRSRRPNLDFVEMQIPAGSVLQSTQNDATATVTGRRKVIFNGEEMFLTAATRIAHDLAYSVAPGPWWTYGGKRLSDIYEETYGDPG